VCGIVLAASFLIPCGRAQEGSDAKVKPVVQDDKITFDFKPPSGPFVFRIAGGKWTAMEEGVYLGDGNQPGGQRLYTVASVRGAFPEEAMTGNAKAFIQLMEVIGRDACPIQVTAELLKGDAAVKKALDAWVERTSRGDPSFKDLTLNELLLQSRPCAFQGHNYALLERFVSFDKERNRTWVMMALPATRLSTNAWEYISEGKVVARTTQDFTPHLLDWVKSQHPPTGDSLARP
jgi:hypothetical protein